jgi:hypothetical protein
MTLNFGDSTKIYTALYLRYNNLAYFRRLQTSILILKAFMVIDEYVIGCIANTSTILLKLYTNLLGRRSYLRGIVIAVFLFDIVVMVLRNWWTCLSANIALC